MKHKLIFILGLFPNLLFSSIFIDVRSIEEFETESIENVLDYLEEIYNLNYKIINNKIIIN